MAGDARADRGRIVDRPPNHHVRLYEIRQWVDARINLRHIPIDSLAAAGELLWHARISMVRLSEKSLVCLIHLVSLIQANKLDRTNRPNEHDRLAELFSILLGYATLGRSSAC